MVAAKRESVLIHRSRCNNRFCYLQTGSGKTFTMMEGYERPELLDGPLADGPAASSSVSGASGGAGAAPSAPSGPIVFGVAPRLLRDIFTALRDSLPADAAAAIASGAGQPSSEALTASAAAAAAAGMLPPEGLTLSFSVKVSCLELYLENVFDLLAETEGQTSGAGAGGSKGQTQSQSQSQARTVTIRENAAGDPICIGLSEVPVSSACDAGRLLARGMGSRAVGATNMNARSSRSHAVFTLYIERRVAMPTGTADETGAGAGAQTFEVTSRSSRIHLVDLAGSERATKSGAEGTRLREAAAINRGLLALGNVINALTGGEDGDEDKDKDKDKDGKEKEKGKKDGKGKDKDKGAAATHVPYRDSK